MVGGYELAERDLFTSHRERTHKTVSEPGSQIVSRAVKGELIGRASVIDGDTIEIQGERIRFNGVDAPESFQNCADSAGYNYRCGAVAARELSQFLARSSPTRCQFLTRDRYGRIVGDCFRADGRSIASWLVRNGHAIDWPRYSGGKYSTEQRAAQAEKRGIWQGTFEAPWDWRRKNR
ncbi:thermonuclease family protein [Stappia sp. GBMRC 2046]|uniref:Thermonuclease family protein n=2 Tax=Stappia sediminis TaxID=2692190 RepID=A0A7X3LSY2_9HYPH|nr:thermonuclease family protein [Stappia sediminis]